MDMRELQSERIEILPQRLETKKVSIGNLNLAIVGQANYSGQLMGVGVVAAQFNGQSNGAWVNQRN